MTTEHAWSDPVRYAGSIAEGPPPGRNHAQAVVYECAACHVLRIERMTDEQGETMDDALNPPKRFIGVAELWDGNKSCTSARIPVGPSAVIRNCSGT